MDKKTILITGASGGLGVKISSYFLEKGFEVISIYNENVPKIERQANLHLYACDFLNQNEIEKLIATINKKHDKIDILINNAGISKSEISWKHSRENWNNTLAVNLTAPFILSKGFLPKMRANKFGRIINISSVVAQTGVAGTSAYAASKAGLFGLTKTLSKEVAKAGITVNTLALGYFNQGMINDVPESFKEKILNDIPLSKLGEPETICKTINFLISDEAGYVTGQTLNLNGGLSS